VVQTRTLRRGGALVTLLAGVLAVAPRVLAAEPTAARRAEVVIGLVPELNVFKQKARFNLLGEYLARKIGVPVRFTIRSRYGNILETFDSERMDGAFFGSFTGALAIARLEVVPLVRPVNLDGTSTYRGYLFVRRDGGIRDAAGMRGKRMAFVDRATTAGYVFPLAWLHEQGARGEAGFFGETWFTGSHDAAIAAVLDGKADVGAAKDTVYERVRAENPRVDRELLILASSPPVPQNGLCVRRELEPDLREALRRALLDLAGDPDGGRILDQLGALRFVETTAADYGPVLALSRRAGLDLAKYQHQPRPQPRSARRGDSGDEQGGANPR
jgi:phosphonate transport system substrate-binding protein